MSSSSTTAPPPAIGWNVQDSDRLRAEVGIGGDDVPGLRILDFRQNHLAARRRDRAGGDAGGDDVGRAGAALHEILRQVHHLAEAVVHHSEPAVGAKHAQPVRHVVQRGVELAGQRRLALAATAPARISCANWPRSALQPMKNSSADDRHGRCNRACHVSASAITSDRRPVSLQLEYPGPAVGPPAPPARYPGGHGDANHMRDGVVADQDRDGAPDAEHAGIDHRADLIARLPAAASSKVSVDLRALYCAGSERADNASHDEKRDARPQQSFPVFSAVMTAAPAPKTRPASIGAEVWNSESISAA